MEAPLKNFKLKFVSLFTLLTVSQLVIANENPYCIAVRGNGELEPAHWGAMAQSLEKFGAASAIAGGSSGSITSFFWESMMANPTLSAKSSDEQSRDMALMFK